MSNLLSVENLTMKFGGLTAIDDLSFDAKNNQIKLHHPDGTHPGMLGAYLGACVIFAFITNKSPVGLSYNYLDRVSKEDRLFLQQIAWELYLEYN